MSKKKINLPKLISFYIIKEFVLSLILVSLIIFSLIILIIYVEELIFLQGAKNENVFVLSFYFTILKAPSVFLDLSHYIFLFCSIFFFIKISKSKQSTSIYLAGLSKRYLLFVPGLFSFFLGLIIITVFIPISAELSKYYELKKTRFSKNENLIIMNSSGIWFKDNIDNKIRIIRAARIVDNNFSLLKKVSIYEINQSGDLSLKIEGESAQIKKNAIEIKNAIVTGDNQIPAYKKEYTINSNINLKFFNLFSNNNVASIWNIGAHIKNLQSIGYFGQDYIIKFNQFISLPIFLFSIVVLSGYYSLIASNKYNNYLCAFFGIFFGILIHYAIDVSIALGKSGKIPIELSVWLPILLIMLSATYNLIKSNE